MTGQGDRAGGGPGIKRGIGDSLRRLLDQRGEERSESASQTAVLIHRGGRHVVGLSNLSGTGAMIRFGGDIAEGDEVILHLLDHGAVSGQVRWNRDGRVGILFTAPLTVTMDE